MALDFGVFNIFGTGKGSRTREVGSNRIVRKATNVVGFDESAEYGSIQEAINDLPPVGGEVFIKEGTYVLKSPLDISKSNVTLRGNSWGVIITGDFLAPGLNALITSTNKDNLLIDNIQFQETNFVDLAINLTNCDNSAITRCFFDTTSDGIQIDDSDFAIIENNFFNGTGSDFCIKLVTTTKHSVIKNNRLEDTSSIWLSGSDKNVVEGNIIIDSTVDGAIELDGADDNIISNNIVFEKSGSTIIAIQAESDSNNNAINSNRVDANTGIKITDANCDKNLVTGNNLVGSSTPLTDNGTNTTAANNNS